MIAARVVFFLISSLVLVVGQTGLSTSDEQDILDAHNSLRGVVDPTASNMETMEWSDELATIAQTYAENCTFQHNSERSAQSSTFTFVGENLAATTGSADYVGLVQAWYDEVYNYTYSTGVCTLVCGHYTQVVWATSRYLGCGAFRCDMLVDGPGDGSNGLNFVCNYGPAGNFDGQMPYESGEPCSACPSDLPFCSSNLCTASEDSNTMNPETSTEPENRGSVVAFSSLILVLTCLADFIIYY